MTLTIHADVADACATRSAAPPNPWRRSWTTRCGRGWRGMKLPNGHRFACGRVPRSTGGRRARRHRGPDRPARGTRPPL